MNELVKIFNAIEIEINDVLDVASTKWNFYNQSLDPILVGGLLYRC